MSKDDLERELKEKEVEHFRVLDEEEHLRSEHIKLLNKLE